MSHGATQGLRPVIRRQPRSLEFIWICDVSGSMTGRYIDMVNEAGGNAVQAIRKQADINGDRAEIFVRVLQFAEKWEWTVAERIPAKHFDWIVLEAQSQQLSSIGPALCEIAKQLELAGTLDKPTLPPVLVLVSDGFTLTLPGQSSLEEGLRAILTQPLGHVSLRFAVVIGERSQRHEQLETLATFVGRDRYYERVKVVANTSEIAEAIDFVTSESIQQASTFSASPVENHDSDWIT